MKRRLRHSNDADALTYDGFTGERCVAAHVAHRTKHHDLSRQIVYTQNIMMWGKYNTIGPVLAYKYMHLRTCVLRSQLQSCTSGRSTRTQVIFLPNSEPTSPCGSTYSKLSVNTFMFIDLTTYPICN